MVRKKNVENPKIKKLVCELKKSTEVMRQFSRIESTKPGTIRRLATTVLTKNGPRIGLLKMAIRQKHGRNQPSGNRSLIVTEINLVVWREHREMTLKIGIKPKSN